LWDILFHCDIIRRDPKKATKDLSQDNIFQLTGPSEFTSPQSHRSVDCIYSLDILLYAPRLKRKNIR